MKKEKTIRTYQRRTKTGKIVTVRQHTAKYDAAEALKKAAKYGAGDELEALKEKLKEKPKKNTLTKEELEALDKEYEAYLKGKKHPMSFDEWRAEKGRSIKSSSKVLKTPKASKAEKTLKSDSSYGFTADEYKAWYHWDQDADPKNKSALKVEKALKKQMGTKAYNKYFDEMSDNYSSRGHNKAFKGLSDTLSAGAEKKSATSSKESTKGISSKKDAIEWFKGNSNYVVTKDGKVYKKLSNGKKGTEVKSRYLLSHAQREDNLARVTDKVAKLASEYGFKKSEADTVAFWTGGKGEPNGKLYRKMSDIPQQVVTDYAKFEDVSPRQARLEMLGMPIGKYNSYLKDAGITPTKKETTVPKKSKGSMMPLSREIFEKKLQKAQKTTPSSKETSKSSRDATKTPRRGSKAAEDAWQKAKTSLTSYVDSSPYKRVLKNMNTYGGQVNKNELIGKLVKKGLSHTEASKIAGQFAIRVKTEFTKARQYRPAKK